MLNQLRERKISKHDQSTTGESEQSLSDQLFAAESQLQTYSNSSLTYDWTLSYRKWCKWDEVENLNEKIQSQKLQYDKSGKEAPFMGHSHDHAEERKIFEMEEKKKVQFCEKHRSLGNYLFEEGNIIKATEQYQLVFF